MHSASQTPCRSGLARDACAAVLLSAPHSQSLASQAPTRGIRPHKPPVGAGLPAMQATRFYAKARTANRWQARLPQEAFGLTRLCRSGLARDAVEAVLRPFFAGVSPSPVAVRLANCPATPCCPQSSVYRCVMTMCAAQPCWPAPVKPSKPGLPGHRHGQRVIVQPA